jgi:hypothetical protein
VRRWLLRVSRLVAVIGGLGVAVPCSQAAQPAQEKETYQKLGFEILASFPFDPQAVNAAPAAARAKVLDQQIPPAIRAWHQRKVEISGFMMPVRLEKGLVTEFLLMRFTAAAMNTNAPAIAEWVRVKAAPGVKPSVQFPVTCFGLFRVQPMFENGYLTAIYQLTAEKVITP